MWNNTARRYFDSAAESKRYDELWLLGEAGYISFLQCQVVFELQPGFRFMGETIRPITYRADFVYYEEERRSWIIEDVKGAKTAVYKLKRALLLKVLCTDPRYADYVFLEHTVGRRSA
ncbi:MAG: DUF1064 domain-containing protein [Chloroflexi bacterium]|nr:DUF1064 domain-containing protein [Chloroflexota bacterium]